MLAVILELKGIVENLRLVDMVMDMLAGGGWQSRLGVLSLVSSASVLELRGLHLKTLSCLRLVTMVELSLFDRDYVVGVLLWQDLLVLEGLHGGVVVILVNFTVNSFGDVLMASGRDGLIDNRCVDSLLDLSGVAMTTSELGNGGFGGVHDEDCLRWLFLLFVEWVGWKESGMEV